MKVYVESQGCSANFSEGEQLKGLIAKQNTLADSADDADSLVLNICTVKGDYRVLKQLTRIKEQYPGKKLVVTGCVTDSIRDDIEKLDPNASILGTYNIDRINDALLNKTTSTGMQKLVKLDIPRKRDNPVVGIVQICSGCLDACAYCSTKLTKGHLFSYPEHMVLREVKKCIEDGCKEIWLTGQDTCCYGFDTNTDIVELLEKITQIDGAFMVRVGMGNLRHVRKYKDRFIEVMKHPKIFRFVHIPVQSGNDEVLRTMLRGHGVQDYYDLVNDLREAIPDITLSTDIIVGYPGETKEQFEGSLSLVEQSMPDAVNIARFAARPNTRAAKLPDQIHGKVSKERSRKLTTLFHRVAAKRNAAWLNWEGVITISEHGKNNTSVGKNYAYKNVVVDEVYPLGTRLFVRIEHTHVFYLKGEIVEVAR